MQLPLSIPNSLIIVTCLGALLLVSLIRRLLSNQYKWRSGLFADAHGYIGKEQYFVEHYAEDTATVSINLEKPLKIMVDFYSPLILESQTYREINPILSLLQALGADYIDIGVHANWLASELPYEKIMYTKLPPKDRFEKVAELLIQLKAKITTIEAAAQRPSGSVGSEPSMISLTSKTPSQSVSGFKGSVPKAISSSSGTPS